MSLIVKYLQGNIISKGLGVSATDAQPTGLCEEVTIALEQVVTTREEQYPLTGIFAGISGWKWNKIRPQTMRNIRNRIESNIGGHDSNLDEGSIVTDWSGGVLSGLKLKNVYEFQDKTKRVGWRPLVEVGTYSVFHKSKRLLSKAAGAKILDNSLSLQDTTLDNSIEITLFKRDRNYNNIPCIQYQNDEMLSSKYSFYLDSDYSLAISTLAEKKIGTALEEKEAIECHSEYMGVGQETRSVLYPEFFPFKNVEVYTIENNTLVKWTEVSNFQSSTSTSKHFKIEPLVGKIIVAKKASETNLYVKEDLGKTIEFYNELEHLPSAGFLTTSAGEIQYYDKGKYKVYLSSVRAVSLSTGDKVNQAQKGQHLTFDQNIYINYTAVPRVDFESSNEDFEDKTINLKPYKKINSNGILELNIDELNIGSVNLRCDKPKIVGNIFGELLLEADASVITAEVLNGNGKPVSEVQVNMVASDGNFEGVRSEIDKVTNLNGECSSSYQYEYQDNALSVLSSTGYINGNTYFETGDIPPGVTAEDVTLFQVLKVDPFYGSLGRRYNVIGTEEQDANTIRITLDQDILDPEDYKTMYTQAFNEDANQPEESSSINPDLCLEKYYNHSVAIFNYGSGIKKKTIIKGAEKNYLLIQQVGEVEAFPSSVNIFKRGELRFEKVEDLIKSQTHDRLIYSYSEADSAYMPIKASRVANGRIYFDDILLPASSLNNDNNIIAGYKLFLPQLVSLKANAVNPANGLTVTSNEIKLKVNFPEYLKGKNGFKFIEEGNDEGGALGGANFITINPAISNTINILVEQSHV